MDCGANQNPYASGSPANDLHGTTADKFSPALDGMGAYYTNPPASGGNPYSQGAAGQYDAGNEAILQGFDNLVAANLANLADLRGGR